MPAAGGRRRDSLEQTSRHYLYIFRISYYLTFLIIFVLNQIEENTILNLNAKWRFPFSRELKKNETHHSY